jgi:uncharacterized protein YecE (DUF72 family)
MSNESAKILIGTSGYSYPGPPPRGWSGVFYPKGRKRLGELEYYSQFFDAVEINTTFYRPPAREVTQAWAQRTPASFEFAVKVWQKFTHTRRIGEEAGEGAERWGAPAQADVDLFRNQIDPLAQSGKLGVLLFQYPPAFHYTKANVQKLQWTLRSFKDYPKVVELRHRSWSDRDAETKALLLESGAGWALIDEPKFASSVRQAFEPLGDVLYFRAHGRNAANWWNPPEAWMRYDYCYSHAEVRELASALKGIVTQKPGLHKAFLFFNNHARGQAVVNAIMLSYEMGIPTTAGSLHALVEAFPQLSSIVSTPTQQSLF